MIFMCGAFLSILPKALWECWNHLGDIDKIRGVLCKLPLVRVVKALSRSLPQSNLLTKFYIAHVCRNRQWYKKTVNFIRRSFKKALLRAITFLALRRPLVEENCSNFALSCNSLKFLCPLKCDLDGMSVINPGNFATRNALASSSLRFLYKWTAYCFIQ